MNLKNIIIVFILVLLFILIARVSENSIGSSGSDFLREQHFEKYISDLDLQNIIKNFIFEDDFESVLFKNRTHLTIPTYDGSGQAVHPDIYYNSSGWNGYKYWMIMSPYPNGNANYENPSIVVSNDGYKWEVPSGLTNPLNTVSRPNFSNDPNLAYKNGVLYVWYGEVIPTQNKLHMRNSTDGINWSNDTTVLQLPSHQIISPAIIYNESNNRFYMWNVDSGKNGYRAKKTYVLLRNSTDGINWNNAQNISISIPGRIIWHINVEYVSKLNEYWMVISAGTKQATKSNELFFAYSTDKLNWTVLPEKIIGHGRDWDKSTIYQSAIQYIDNTVKIWYSATNEYPSGNWGIGYAETSLADLKIHKYP